MNIDEKVKLLDSLMLMGKTIYYIITLTAAFIVIYKAPK